MVIRTKGKKEKEKVFTGEYPRFIKAEEALLASLILHPENFYQISDKITKEDFFLKKHEIIYDAICKLTNENRQIDLVAIADLVKDHVSYEELSTIIQNIPDIINIEQYAKVIKDKSILRKLIDASNSALVDCLKQEKEPSEILEEIDKQIYEIYIGSAKEDFIPLSTIVNKNLKNLEALRDEKRYVSGISTGFDKLDELTCGFQPSDFIIIAGRPSTGKTSFALSISLNMAAKGRAVGFLSLEMSKEQLGLRLLCANANLDLQKVRSGYLGSEDYAKLAISAQELEKYKIYIDDSTPTFINEIRAKCRRLQKNFGLDILFLDYIQLIQTHDQYENRNLQLGAISATLKSIAKEFNIPVVALSQLSRNPERKRGKDAKPTMADLRESGNLEQDADLVIILYRNNELDQNNLAEVIIEKQRNGPRGSFNLVFIKSLTLFMEPAGQEFP